MDWKTIAASSVIPILLTVAITQLGNLSTADEVSALTTQNHGTRITILEAQVQSLSALQPRVQSVEQELSTRKSIGDTALVEFESLKDNFLETKTRFDYVERVVLQEEPTLQELRVEIEQLRKEIDDLDLQNGTDAVLLSSIGDKLSVLNGKLSIIEQEVFKK